MNKKPLAIFVPGSATSAAIVYGNLLPLITDMVTPVARWSLWRVGP